MKESVLGACALALLSGSAHAQSSVTIFGVVDTGFSHYEVKSVSYANGPLFTTTIPSNQVKRSQNALSNSASSNSRLGFRATEDLGGGLAASFWLESPLTPDDGALGVVFQRRSTVSLSGTFGELRLGRDFTPSFWNDTVYDPFGAVGVGTNMISSINTRLAILGSTTGPGAAGALNGGASGGTDNYVRSSNSIGYFLPPSLGGVYGQVMYALHENVKSDGAATPNPSKRGRYIGGRLGYSAGGLDVSAAYGESVPVDATSSTTDPGAYYRRTVKTANLGASYDFGFMKLIGEVSRVTNNVDRTAPGVPISTSTSDAYTGALVGVTVPVGPGLVRASYSRVRLHADPAPLIGSAFLTQSSSTADKLALGYVHNLSKRTALYATAARIQITNGQVNPVMAASAGGAATYFTSGNAVGFAPRRAMGYDFGIRHAF